MYKIFLTLLLATLLSAAVYDGIAIIVKDKAITLMDIKQEMESNKINVTKASDNLIRQKLEEIEIDERKITVDSSEVYDEIKQAAAKNNLTISEFYEAVRNSNGISSTELKEKMKQRLLSQKLYSAISYTSLSEPTEDDIKEYYELNKESFKHPSEFTVTIYQSKDKSRLQEKIDNPMFYSPDIQTNEQVLPYDRISPELARLLEKTPLNHFTPIVPDGQNGHMSFYVKEIKTTNDGGLESVHDQIINSIMSDKRELVLSNYFARLRQNIEIKTLRVPQ